MDRQGRAACNSKNEQTQESIPAANKSTVIEPNGERLRARMWPAEFLIITIEQNTSRFNA